MIKEHFTDGLISLAILLSLFRTDLTGINDIINYPEVQDIILGNTAAYLPTSFHSSPQTLSRKHIEIDNDAFSSWYHNINNLPLIRSRSQNHIEAFLVSVGLPSEVIPQPAAQTANIQVQHQSNEDASDVRNSSSSPTLPFESAGTSSDGNVSLSFVRSGQTPSNDTSPSPSLPVSLTLDNPFPGCNLTIEDLQLIDVLWRQDVDLGVGKEAFDQNLRLELEKERQLEVAKEQEKARAQRLAAQKEERDRQELANKWLKENFMRDGETGEWVRLPNGTLGNISEAGFLPVSQESQPDEWTLEQALDYISVNGGEEFVPPTESSTSSLMSDPGHVTSQEQTIGETAVYMSQQTADYNTASVSQTADYTSASDYSSPGVSYLPPQQVYHHQDSLEENWTGLVDYLNMTSTPPVLDNAAPPVTGVTTNSPPLLNQEFPGQEAFLLSDLDNRQYVDVVPAATPPLSDQSQFLLQNVSMPTGVDTNNDLNVLTPVVPALTSDLSPAVAPDTPAMDWGNLSFFNNLTSLSGEDSGNLDLVNSIFLDMATPQNLADTAATSQIDLREDMDTLEMLGDQLAGSLTEDLHNSSVTSGSPLSQNITDAFEGLEGATGGLDLSHGNLDLMDERFDLRGERSARGYTKMSRLSESSSDSGMGAGYSSPDPSPPTSSAASPASSHGSNMTTSNHTELEPRGSRAGVLPHIAHNHTYNTLPGQTPREVKKYAHKEPSRKGPQSRDAKRASEMKIPFPVSEIINSPVETFNEMLTKHKLSEPQLALIRDIRRRGKNKVAAQNCRKRKVGVIVTLADEMEDLHKMRDRLLAERREMEKETRQMKDKFSNMYANIFQSLRNDQGQPYDPNLYSLQQSSDGNVFLVPRNLDRNRTNTTSTTSSTKDAPSEGSGSRKRKAYDH